MLNKKLVSCFDYAIIACLCLLIFCLPFAKAGVETFVWIGFFLWLTKRTLGYRAESFLGIFPETELNKALGVFIAVNLTATIFTVNSALSLRGFFGKEIKFMAIYFMLVETINDKRRLKIILMTIIASAILIIADALVQYYRGIDFLRGYPSGRLTASFISANGFAAWLLIIIFLFLGMLANSGIIGSKMKVTVSFLTVMLLICLIATYARGAWFGFLAGVFIVFCYIIRNASFKMKTFYLFIIVSLLGGIIFLPQPLKTKFAAVGKIDFKIGLTLSDRITSTVKMNEGSVLFRIKLWQEALGIIRDFPLTGSGLNTYSVVAPHYKIIEGGGVYPHNSFLQMAAETGVMGVMAFFGFLLKFFQVGISQFKQKNNYLIPGLLLGISAFLIHAFFDTHLYSLQLAVFFWFMVGLTMAVTRLDIKEALQKGI